MSNPTTSMLKNNRDKALAIGHTRRKGKVSFFTMEGANLLPNITPKTHGPAGVFDFSDEAPYNPQLLKHADIKAPIPLVLELSLEKRIKKARRSAELMLEMFEREVLTYRTSHPLSFFEDRRAEYLGVRSQVTSGKYAQLIDGICAEYRSVFGNVSPNPYSTRIYTSDGQKLIVAFQYAAPESFVQQNQLAGTLGKWPDISKQPKKLSKLDKNHLIPEKHRILALQGVQSLLSVVPPEKVHSSRRHGAVDPALQRSHYFTHMDWDGQGQKTPERIGTLHVVACWPQQGHPNQIMSPSASFSANARAGTAHERFYLDTLEVNIRLDAIMKHEFPEQYPKFCEAHLAGRWTEVDPGPHLGRVIVWKLQSMPHLDDSDSLPTIIYVLSGNFIGAYLDMLDLKTRFLYPPGSLIVGFFGFVWHVIAPYEDRACTLKGNWANHGFTPGRVSVVNFFPEKSFHQLVGKPPGWGKRTAYGSFPDNRTK